MRSPGGPADMWVTGFTNVHQVRTAPGAPRQRHSRAAPAAAERRRPVGAPLRPWATARRSSARPIGGIAIQAAQNFTDTQQEHRDHVARRRQIDPSATSCHRTTQLVARAEPRAIWHRRCTPIGSTARSQQCGESVLRHRRSLATSSYTGDHPRYRVRRFVGRQARGTAAAPAASPQQNGDGFDRLLGAKAGGARPVCLARRGGMSVQRSGELDGYGARALASRSTPRSGARARPAI